MTASSVHVRLSRQQKQDRLLACVADDPELADRLLALKEFSRTVRTAQVFLTNSCNIRCKGCWFFDHGLDQGIDEVRDLDELTRFADGLRSRGVTTVLLLGGEPSLVPRRIGVFADRFPYTTVVTNGMRKVPEELHEATVAVSVFGGGPVDDDLRAIRPNGRTFTGLFDTALANYRDDPRVVWVYSLTEAGIAHIEPTVRRIADNGNQVSFGFYSSYGTDDPTRLVEGRRLLDEALRVRERYADVVVSHPYYIEALVTGRTHWAEWGYDVCPSISVDHPAHVDRLANGNPVLPAFNAYRANHDVQFCCTSGDCEGCRDSQAMFSWVLVSMEHFLDSPASLRTWVEIAESFYRQFYWSPYHPRRRDQVQPA